MKRIISGRRRQGKRICLVSMLVLVAIVCHVGVIFAPTFALMPLTGASCQSRTTKKFCKSQDEENDGDCGAPENESDPRSESNFIDGSGTELNMNEFQQRKRKLALRSRQQRWHQPPNPFLEDPIEFVQAVLGTFQQTNRNNNDSAALCLLRSSTPSWRRLLLKSVGAPPDATIDQVAPTLQNALERSNNQFAILTKKIQEEIEFEGDDEDPSLRIASIQKCWNFPTDPVIFEGDDNNEDDIEGNGRIVVDKCWIESRLRSPKEDELLAVVG